MTAGLGDGAALALVAAGVLVAFALLYAALAGGAEGGAVKRRLDRVSRAVDAPARGGTIRRTTHDSGIPGFDRLLKRFLPQPAKLRARLARTGRRISIGEYLLATLLITALTGVVFGRLLGFPLLIALPLAVIAGAGLPHMVIGHMGRRRIARFLETFPDAIDLICRGLRSGLPIAESISAVGREMPDPIGTEFRSVADNVRLGHALEAAMWQVAKRIDVPEYKYLITAMAIQRETGGNLAETLSNLSDLLRKRRQLKLKIKAMSSEARASAWIIGSLPFLMLAILMLINTEYVMTLFTDPRGLIMTGVGLAFITIGVLVMAKMVRFEI